MSLLGDLVGRLAARLGAARKTRTAR